MKSTLTDSTFQRSSVEGDFLSVIRFLVASISAVRVNVTDEDQTEQHRLSKSG